MTRTPVAGLQTGVGGGIILAQNSTETREGTIFRRKLLISGLVAVVGIFVFSAHYWHADRYTKQELAGGSAKADLSGAEMRMELSPVHGAEYTIRLTIDLNALNDQGFEGERWVCKLADPKTLDENCKGFHFVPGHVDALITVRDGVRPIISQRNTSLNGYLISGQEKTQAVRELGRFVAAPGHQYTISARLRSDDSDLGKMNPTLRASISSDYLEGEAYADVFVEILTFLGVVGLVIMTLFEFVIRPSSKSQNRGT